ncbi:hypothetical protein EYR41_009328 [Orbilia oligospora]|uniref:Uncharacterized protein n=1 Tax=Orbilia oligospora TaxID=2813651 RepID=A0A7C8KA32_ORBOL|nr:hypothetical protein TWF751_007634 [Orbilia oligospora]TGJ65353.1 hypothetical protein EYR41_009328 [Orbilia oligospora]
MQPQDDQKGLQNFKVLPRLTRLGQYTVFGASVSLALPTSFGAALQLAGRRTPVDDMVWASLCESENFILPQCPFPVLDVRQPPIARGKGRSSESSVFPAGAAWPGGLDLISLSDEVVFIFHGLDCL